MASLNLRERTRRCDNGILVQLLRLDAASRLEQVLAALVGNVEVDRIDGDDTLGDLVFTFANLNFAEIGKTKRNADKNPRKRC